MLSNSIKFRSYLELVKQANNYPYPTHKSYVHGDYLFKLTEEGNDIIGILESDVADLLRHFQLPKQYQEQYEFPIFNFTAHPNGNHFISFTNNYNNYSKRTEIIDIILKIWRKNDDHVGLRGWRDEIYPVIPYTEDIKEPVFQIERSGSFLFGFSTFGVHLNGYTRQNNEIKMWIARRSPTKQTWPNMLDNMVAGGVSIGEEKYTTIVRECMEEASIPYEISSKAVACNALTYITQSEYGIAPETQYIYDLELSPDFIPTPNDGEVGNFYLMGIDELKENLFMGEFKPNCGIIVIDFLIRHGFIKHDEEPDYLAILQNIHRTFDFHYE